ncbi:TVP38/TMEM64 family protein [Stackebrandtia endophytica]|uniref:TVP38/TMEM64 family protein n=1 Tax=Stackebrandtia endophytica TaxID=1496996 RepID=UPI00114E1920|nr:TVP38/TMEM64 family protein [Stackebrandtia endophytica]
MEEDSADRSASALSGTDTPRVGLATPVNRPRWAVWKFGALAAGITVAAAAVALFGSPDLQALQRAAIGLGPIGSVVAIAGVALAILIMVPRTVLAITVGMLFGWFPAAVYITVGALIGASTGFALGRLLGREYVAVKLSAWSATAHPIEPATRGLRARSVGWLKRQLANVDSWLERDGILGIWIVRMIPVAHYGITSYAAGVATVRYRHFLIGTLLGTIPGAIGFTAVGGAVLEPEKLPLASGLATLVGLLGLTVTWLVRRRRGLRGSSTDSISSARLVKGQSSGVDASQPASDRRGGPAGDGHAVRRATGEPVDAA